MSPPTKTPTTAIITTAARTLLGVQPIRIHATATPGGSRGELSVMGLSDEHRSTHDRIRSAILSCGLTWPPTPITVSIVGQPLPEMDRGVDLACALAFLTVTGHIPPGFLDQVGCCGELDPDGTIRPVQDPQQRIMVLHRAGFRRMIVPATAVSTSPPSQPVIWAARNLREIIERLRDSCTLQACGFAEGFDDLSDLRIRRMITIAAAGGHHLALIGCPEQQASHISRVLAGLLPDLDDLAIGEVADVYWQAGRPRPAPIRTRPPWIGPVSVLTAGLETGPAQSRLTQSRLTQARLTQSRLTEVRLAEVRLAHHGVYCPTQLHTLTTDQIRILQSILDQRRLYARDKQETRSWPAAIQLVLATDGAPLTDGFRAILDRVDLQLKLGPPPHHSAFTAPAYTSTPLSPRINQARAAATRRWSPHTHRPTLNAEVAASEVYRTLPLLPSAYLRRKADTARVSTRGWIGILRLAWTIADLADHHHPHRTDVDEAMTWRTGGQEQR